MATTGQFAVSDTGAASYSVPIAVPPGIANLEPRLTLTYNSQGGNGIVGVGWNLSGLSAISRCPRTKSQDGAFGRVGNDLNDRYCLDGQRLMLTAGSHGANASEYRTEIESFSQIKAYGAAGTAPDGGPAYFIVKTKSGLTMWYGNWDGNASDAGLAAQGRSVIRVWALKKVQDTKGNYMKVTYTNDNANGQIYPARIDYTANDTVGATVAAPNTVYFDYEARPDIVPMYQADSLIKSTVRLTKIRTVTDAGDTATAQTSFAYDTSPATSRSRLTTVTQCGTKSGSTCVKPLNITWQGDVAGFDATNGTLNWNFGNPVAYQLVVGDFNGDGRTDFIELSDTRYFVFLANGNGGFTSTAYTFPFGWNFGAPVTHQSIVGDFNGDGKTDFMEIGGNNYYLMLANGDGTFAAPQSSYTFPIGLNFDSINGNGDPQFSILLGDWNGDGRSDFSLLGLSLEGLYTFVSKGDGTFAGTYASRGGRIYGNNLYPYAFDADSDGILDIAFSNTSGTISYVAGSDDGSFKFAGSGAGVSIRQTCSSANICTGPTISYPAYLKQLDLNADGLPDIFNAEFNCPPRIAGTPCTSTGIKSTLNKGIGQIPILTWTGSISGYYAGLKFENISSPLILDNVPYLPNIQISGDFNGDHLGDFAYIHNTNLYIHYGKGDGTFTKVVAPFDNALNFGSFGKAPYNSPAPTNSWQVVSGDFNGDGRTDFLVVGGNSYYLFTAKGPIPDVAATITDGLGAQVKLSYSTPAQSLGTNYTAASGLVWPKSSVTPAQSIVTQARMSTGTGAWRDMAYSYGGALLEQGQTGRGYMGFAWMQTKDVGAGLVSRAYRRQDWPYVGLPDWSGLSTSEANWDTPSGKTDFIKRTTYQHVCSATSSSGSVAPCSALTIAAESRYAMYASQIDEQAWDYSGTSTVAGTFVALPRSSTTQVQDAWGNPTSIKRDVLNADGSSAGFSKTTTNTFAPADTAKWQLGQLLRSSVVSTAP